MMTKYSNRLVQLEFAKGAKKHDYEAALKIALEANQMLLWDSKLEGIVQHLAESGIDTDKGVPGLLNLINSYDKRAASELSDESLFSQTFSIEDDVLGTGLADIIFHNYRGLINRNLGIIPRNIIHRDSAKDDLKSALYKCDDDHIPKMQRDIWRGYIIFNMARLNGDEKKLLKAMRIRKRNAERYQAQFRDGKNHLVAEAGYAFAYYGNTLLIKHSPSDIFGYKLRETMENVQEYVHQCMKDARGHPLTKYSHDFMRKADMTLLKLKDKT
jgi:hypothetical protein